MTSARGTGKPSNSTALAAKAVKKATALAAASAPAAEAEAPKSARSWAPSSTAPKKKRAGTHLRPPEHAVAFVRTYEQRLQVPADVLQMRCENMKKDATIFFRSTPALFAQDLAATFAREVQLSDRPAPRMTVLGDAHLGNFGAMRGPEGQAVWGINDFDSSGRGSPELDLARMSASIVLTARAAGVPEGKQQGLVQAFLDQYTSSVGKVAQGDEPARAWLSARECCGEPVGALLKKDLSRRDFVAKFAELGERPRFKLSDVMTPVTRTEDTALRAALAEWEKALPADGLVTRPLVVLDSVKRLAGGSSFGMPRFAVLLKNARPDEPPILVELKAGPASPLADVPAACFNPGQVLKGQRAMGSLLNPLAGAVSMGGQSMLVREMEPEKGSVALEKISSKDLRALVEDAGRALGRAHASDEQSIAQLSEWVRGMDSTAGRRLGAFGQKYAAQVERDLQAFQSAS